MGNALNGDDGAGYAPCPTCHGRGVLTRLTKHGEEPYECPTCKGMGRIVSPDSSDGLDWEPLATDG